MAPPKSKTRQTRAQGQTGLHDHFSSSQAPSSSSPQRPSPKKSSPKKLPPRKSSPRKRPLPAESSTNDSDVEDSRNLKFHTRSTTEPSEHSHEGSGDEIIDLTIDEPERSRADTGEPKASKMSSSGEGSGSDEFHGAMVKKRQTKKRRLSLRSRSDDSDQKGLPPPPQRRRLVRGRDNAVAEWSNSATEEEDLLEEVDSNSIIKDNTRISKKVTGFALGLDKLKRRKKGKVSSSESGSESNESSAEEEDISEHRDEPFAGAAPADEFHEEKEGDAEDDWIIQDDVDIDSLEIPEEFSMASHQDLGHHFKIVCQLFVTLATKPPKKRKRFLEKLNRTNYFSTPLKSMRRRLHGMRDSLVASSTWKPGYKATLERYPYLSLTQLDFAIMGCDACHFGSKKSTFVGRLSGDPYDRDTFATLESDKQGSSEEDDSSDEDVKDKKESRQFHLGRFCARRTRAFHSFTHWQHTLFEALHEEIDLLRIPSLDKQGSGRVFVQVAREDCKIPKNLDDSNELMEWLDDRGIIQRELKKLKDMMEMARGLEIGGKGNDDMDDLLG